MADSQGAPAAEVLIHTVTTSGGITTPAMTLQSGQLQCTVIFSPDQARLFAKVIPEQLENAATIAEQHTVTPLITPDTATVSHISKGKNNA